MRDIDRAKDILINQNKTCVLCMGNITYCSEKTGISPMMDYITENVDLSHFSVADKIVGKAAALLFVLANVNEVYAEVMSRSAQTVFEKHNIAFSYDNLTDYIINRKGEGMCPMEQAVLNIDNPHDAFQTLCEKIRQLRQA